MKKFFSLTLFQVSILVLALSIVQPARAHGDEPRLEVSVDQLSPGGAVDLRGVDFEPEELVSLSLTGPSGEIAIGEVTVDIEGVFLYMIVLPADLAEGTYSFQAVTDDHKIFSPPLFVSGIPMLEDVEAEGQRDEDDTLLAPMPTYSPVVVQSADAPAEAAPAEPDLPPFLIPVATLIVIGVIAVAGLWIFQKR